MDADEETIASDETLTDERKRDILQRSLNMAASNGDVERVRRLVQGKAKDYVDVNKPDEEGTVPLIYASCFVRPLVRSFPVAGPLLELSGLTFGLAIYRDTKMLLRRSLMQERMLTSKTGIDGVP
jgi:hypothetical protein